MEEAAAIPVDQEIVDVRAWMFNCDRERAEINAQQADMSQRLLNQEKFLITLNNNVEQLLKNFVPQAPNVSPQAPPLQAASSATIFRDYEPKLQMPNRYEGVPGKCRNFLAQCELFFRSQPSRFLVDESRISFILSLLSGTALDWAGPLIRTRSIIVGSSDRLMKELISVFDHNITVHDAATRLMHLEQGRKSVAEFSIEFRSLASSTDWPEGPLMTLFIHALSEPVRDALATLEPHTSLDALVQTAIRIDNRVRERTKERQSGKGGSRHFQVSTPKNMGSPALSDSLDLGEPMQVDSALVKRSSNVRRRKIVCYHCNKPGHIKPFCPDLQGNGQSL